jgi:hypothetical protein
MALYTVLKTDKLQLVVKWLSGNYLLQLPYGLGEDGNSFATAA